MRFDEHLARVFYLSGWGGELKGFAPKMAQQVKPETGKEANGLPCLLGLLTCQELLTPILRGCTRLESRELTRQREARRGSAN